MTMQTYVFFEKENMPDLAALQNEVKNNGFDFTLPDQMSLSSSEPTFIEGKFENLESCFDYLCAPYAEDDWEWSNEDKSIIKNPNSISVFNTYSNAQEIVGMLVISSVLAKITNGVMLSEFFSDELIPSSEAIEFAKEIIESSRDQFSGPSKMRG